MDTVCEHNKCAGCMACVDICPKGAITIQDSLQAYNAVIDSEKCVGCNACHRVCQENHPVSGSIPIKWCQGWAKNEKMREKCSSGGVATEISKTFVENGGVVCSCTFQNGQFIFGFAEKANEVDKFTGSKYVKSNPAGIYREIKRRLQIGQGILFIGLPCQVSALKNYVGPLNVNLYTMDLICHGTPSPQVLKIFLEQYRCQLDCWENISFRNKTKFQISGDGKSITTNGVCDRYSLAFLNSLIYTENCYSCPYAKSERISDVTLGDSWGSKLSLENQKKGVSLLIIQTLKGRQLVNDSKLVLFDVDINNAIANNHQLSEPSKMPEKRSYFFDNLKAGENFNRLIFNCMPKQCIRQNIKKELIDFHILK